MNYPCDVELIAKHRRCGATPAEKFTARCTCGHEISGHACGPCRQSRAPGCFTCWRDGKGHQCPVTFGTSLQGVA